MGNHKMKGFVVGFYVAIFALLKLSLQEQMEGEVVAGLISVDQSKAGDYAAGEAPQVFQIKAKAHNNPDFKPTKCVAKGPDGTKYEMKPGATFKDKKIKCLCDCIILPPTECGVAFTCIDSSMEGTWNVTMYNSNGDIIIVQQSVKQHSLTCTFHPVDGQWGEWVAGVRSVRVNIRRGLGSVTVLLPVNILGARIVWDPPRTYDPVHLKIALLQSGSYTGNSVTGLSTRT